VETAPLAVSSPVHRRVQRHPGTEATRAVQAPGSARFLLRGAHTRTARRHRGHDVDAPTAAACTGDHQTVFLATVLFLIIKKDIGIKSF
jgi:hypothetical protein